MRTISKSAVAALSAGLLVAGLAGCAEPSASKSGGSSSSSAAASESPSASASPTPAAVISKLSGVHTQVTLDANFLKALTTLKLTPGVVGKATLSKAGVLTFPITGGNVTYFDPASGVKPYVTGMINHDGSGISLSAGGKKVSLTDFVIDPGSNSHINGTVKLNGKLVGKGVNIFRLDGKTLKPLSKDAKGNAVLEGTQVYISEDAAALLNKTYGTQAVTGKLLVGIAKITAK